MTDAPFLDHKAIMRLAAQTPKLSAILAQREIFDAIDPITPAIVDDMAEVEAKGYFATADGRIIFRLVGKQEAREIFDRDAATLAEAFLVAERISQIGDIENAALAAQTRAVKLARACQTMFDTINTGTELSKKDRIRIGQLLHEIRTEDAAKAAKIEAMKAENAQHDRDRRWALRQAGAR